MKKNQSSRSGLLLMEIIIAILFFSIVSAVCLQLFVKAHNLSQETSELDLAVRQASSVAELINQSDQPLKKLQESYPTSDMDDNTGSIYFDEGFMACERRTAAYRMDITSDKADDRTVIYNVVIYITANEKEIYRLETISYKQYIPKKQK